MESFVRIHQGGDFVDAKAHHYDELRDILLTSSREFVEVELVGDDPAIIRVETIDSVALISDAGTRFRKMHQDEWSTLLDGDGDDPPWRRSL